MASKLNMFVLLALATMALFQNYALAATYEVGDSMGWIIPSGGAAAYSTWAANKTFNVGDKLVFKFTSGQHDVAKVNKAAYDACNVSNTISIQNSSPANISLQSAGQHYFICTFGGHCSAGQKLAINVSGAAASPTPQPSTSPISPAPEPTSTATPPSAATPPSTSTSTPPSSSANPPSTSSTSPSPSASTTPSSPSPAGVASTPENSASSTLGFVGLFSTFLSIAFALSY